MTARLLDVAALGPAVAGNRLAVSDARDLGRRLDAVLTPELLEGHVQVDVAKSRDDQLLGLLHAFHVQRRIFFAQPCQAARDLLLVAARLRGDRHAVGRPRQIQRRQGSAVLHAQRLTGERVRELGRRADVTGAHLCRGDVVLATRKKDLRKPFFAASAQVG